MDTNSWRSNPSQAPVGGAAGAGGAGVGGEPTMDTGDWRNQLPPDSRQRIVNKIMDTLKRHLPVSGQEGLHELKKIAIRFEEKIYTAATSQSDYLRKISLKMLTMETKSQNPIVNSLPSNAAGSSNEHPDSVSLDSMAQTGHANGGDWQEEVCQELKAIKEKLESSEKQILHFINTNGARNPVASLQQGQLPLPHSMQQPQSPITKLQSHENQRNPQLQSMNFQGSVSSLDSTAQTGHANGGDWQEEAYQKITAMKEMYLPEINEMHQKIANKLQQHDSLPQQPRSDQLEKLKMFRTMLERIITFLQVSKSDILPNFKEKLGAYEKQILNFINTNKPRKPVSSLQQGQLPPPHVPSTEQP
ncbi:mediator of RNA polymerase II transcription subunit 15a-like isoform X2 [Alnus glutinosa]|uniref:mediator of RNA polymerase II transcription subunit 15a-like isoform X2 n=1 Tax=Alnus glutinosa TaxID=3517 RepID=UPI002D77B4DE|nr:mediator of RNA polymerase II transcription subunit 15a-like isoform X2 [Alnus glutinosa]